MNVLRSLSHGQTSKKAVYLKLKIEEITSSGLDLKEVLDKDWLNGISQGHNKIEVNLSAPVSLDLKLAKSERDIFINGVINTELTLKCSRCLEEFDYPLDSRFKYTLCPADDEDIADDLGLSSEDLEFGFYHGDEIDIAPLILEQIIISIPLKPLCHNLCRGLCHRCAKDLNEGRCECSGQEVLNIGFSKLRDFKVASGK